MNSPIKRAIISVSDKSGLADFARQLASGGVEIYSTGGTAKFLAEQGISVRDVSAYTGFPEMMDGRLKTLHPKIFGGILCRHDRSDDMSGIAEHGICTFELVVVNLYPFEATIARAGVTPAEAIEQVDIGGPSLVRAAAKNHAFTTIATDHRQYGAILEEFNALGGTTMALRQKLAADAYARTASYDRAIADWYAAYATNSASPAVPSQASVFPADLTLTYRRKAELRYGENPHQAAALYEQPSATGANLVNARQLNGKELSYNNLLDLDTALAIARSLPGKAVAVLKHNNPCGAASADKAAIACQRAMDGDPQSAFGSVLGFNCTVDAAAAEVLAAPGLFVEAIVAPHFDAEALNILTTKPKWKENVRLMAVGELTTPPSGMNFRQIEGGLLVQDADLQADLPVDWQIVTEKQPTDEQLSELNFAWALVRHVKSNAIVVTREHALCGAGAGQMSRVDSVEIALSKSGERANGAVMGSDAFFPFPDSIERAAAGGISAIIQPGGSKKDNEVIAACNRLGIAMVFTGRRHFKH